jgi:hypothetical protein
MVFLQLEVLKVDDAFLLVDVLEPKFHLVDALTSLCELGAHILELLLVHLLLSERVDSAI